MGGNVDHACVCLFGTAYASSVNHISSDLHEMVLPKQSSEHVDSLAMSLKGNISFQTSK